MHASGGNSGIIGAVELQQLADEFQAQWRFWVGEVPKDNADSLIDVASRVLVQKAILQFSSSIGGFDEHLHKLFERLALGVGERARRFGPGRKS